MATEKINQLDLFDDIDSIVLSDTSSVDTINMNSVSIDSTLLNDTISLGAIGSAQLGTMLGSITSPTYTINTSANWNWANVSAANPVMISGVDGSGTIDLKGDNADIKVNGESLMQTLHKIQDRLNILRPNTELENEWDQLKELGERYRQLESELKEKSKMWNTLKSMPPPDIE